MDDQFKHQVFEIVSLIPMGRVSTYGAIAKAVGYPNHSRYVGKIMGVCPKSVPAHRVVGACGRLAVPEFRAKLERESIFIKENGSVKDFKSLFWDPLSEL